MLIYPGGWGLLVLVAIILQVTWVVTRSIRSKGGHAGEYYQVAVLSGLALGSAAQVYPIACADHVYWALAPGFGVFVYFIYRSLRLNSAYFSLALLLLLAPAAHDKYRWGRYTLSQPMISLSSPPVLRGMHVNSDFAGAIERTYQAIRLLLEENPNQSVVFYGDDALYLTFFDNGYNPSPYYVSWVGLVPLMEQRRRSIYIFSCKPVLLIQDRGTGAQLRLPDDYAVAHHEPSLSLRVALPRQMEPTSNYELRPSSP